MSNSKITRRAFVSSLISLILCFVMLLGTSYAYFSAEVSSKNNKVQSGTLLVDLLVKYDTSDSSEYESVTDNPYPIFSRNDWQPGTTETVYVKVENIGSLAAKYNMQLIPSQLDAVNDIAKYIDVYIASGEIDVPTDSSKEETLAVLSADTQFEKIGTLAEIFDLGTLVKNELLLSAYSESEESSDEYTVVLRMQDNTPHDMNGQKLGSYFDLRVYATQTAYESDSFGADYDAGAKLPDSVYVTAEEFDNIDFGIDHTIYIFTGNFADPIEIDELGSGSSLIFNHVTANDTIYLPDGATVAGSSSITSNADGAVIEAEGNLYLSHARLTLRGGAYAISLTGDNARLSVTSSEITADSSIIVQGMTAADVTIADSTLVLCNETLDTYGNIFADAENGTANVTVTDSHITAGTLTAGSYSVPAETGSDIEISSKNAALSVTNSVVYANSSYTGAIVSAHGTETTSAEFSETQIYIYHTGWDESKISVDNPIQIGGNGSVSMNIENSNMQIYAPVALIDAGIYGNDGAEVNYNVKNSFIWTISKDANSGIRVNGTDITNGENIADSVLLRVRNAFGGDKQTVDGAVIGNPVITTDFDVTQHSKWTYTLPLTGEQVLAVNSNTAVRLYDDAAKIVFSLAENAKIIIYEAAAFTNFTVTAADGYTLVTNVTDGVTTHSVTSVAQ